MSSAICLLLSGKYSLAYIAPTAFVKEPKKYALKYFFQAKIFLKILLKIDYKITFIEV